MEVCRGELGGATSPFLYHSFARGPVRPAHGCRNQRYQSQSEFISGHMANLFIFISYFLLIVLFLFY